MTPTHEGEGVPRHEIETAPVAPTKALTVRSHTVLQRAASTEIATREAALAVRAAALEAWRGKLVEDAQATRARADAIAAEWRKVEAGARAEIEHVGEAARAAATSDTADTHCYVCHRPADGIWDKRAAAPAQADVAPRPDADEKAGRGWALERVDDEQLDAPARRVCSKTCADRLIKIHDERAHTARAMTDAAREAAAKAAGEAEHEATQAEWRVALVKFEREALKKEEAARTRAVWRACKAERAAEAHLAKNLDDFDAELALSGARQARQQASAAHWAAWTAWEKLLEEEAEARHADGRPWPRRHCLSCELRMDNPNAEFCKEACAQAGRNDAGVASGAFRCVWCRRTFLAPEDTAWPDDGDQPPVCTVTCLAAAPLDSDLWENFQFPEIVYVGPIPTTSAGRQALSRRLEAARRKRTSAAGTSGAPSRSAERPAVNPSPSASGAARPARACARAARLAPGRGGGASSTT